MKYTDNKNGVCLGSIQDAVRPMRERSNTAFELRALLPGQRVFSKQSKPTPKALQMCFGGCWPVLLDAVFSDLLKIGTRLSAKA